jgi:hypothetical protein
MHKISKYLYPVVFILLFHLSYGDTGIVTKREQTLNAKAAVKKSVRNIPVNDEQLFRQFLKRFKYAVKQKNREQLLQMISFPLQTTPQWTNEDLKSMHVDPKAGLIDRSEFLKYYDDIFSHDAVRLIPASGENDLAEIDHTSPENYYKTIRQVTDKGSSLFELQKQYTQDNGKETSFGFVFGKVGGVYKVISYYCPWPLK